MWQQPRLGEAPHSNAFFFFNQKQANKQTKTISFSHFAPAGRGRLRCYQPRLSPGDPTGHARTKSPAQRAEPSCRPTFLVRNQARGSPAHVCCCRTSTNQRTPTPSRSNTTQERTETQTQQKSLKLQPLTHSSCAARSEGASVPPPPFSSRASPPDPPGAQLSQTRGFST